MLGNWRQVVPTNRERAREREEGECPEAYRAFFGRFLSVSRDAVDAISPMTCILGKLNRKIQEAPTNREREGKETNSFTGIFVIVGGRGW